MEEFKIIKLPQKEEEKQEVQEAPIERKVDDDYQPPRKRFIFLILLILIVIVAIFVIKIFSTYEDYEAEKTWERSDSAECAYSSFNDNLIKYSPDGVSYTSYDGSLIWNYTYDMVNPNIDICQDYVVVYDKKGNEVDIFSTKGFVQSITTNTPIVEAKVAKQGTIAILLQENNISYIQMYDKDAKLLVSGEIHPENKGFPVSMALSSDATRLLLSIVNVNSGELSSELVFYDFTDDGKEEEDNIVASHTYLETIIPKVDFVKNDKAIAFCDSKIIIFNNNLNATVAKEISVEGQMKSIFYNDTHFGYISETETETGEVVNELNVYNLYGFRWISKEITESYDNVEILDNNEIFLLDDNTVTIYNLQGIAKFTYDFDEIVYKVAPGSSSRRYYLIEETKTEEIYIK